MISMKATGMYIHLKGLKFFAYHGVLPQENKVGAEYSVDIRLETDFNTAAETDNLDGTVNYAEVFKTVKREMNTPSKLLEHVAYRIGQRILENFPTVTEVRINLYKRNPPMEADCSDIGIESTYTRDETTCNI